MSFLTELIVEMRAGQLPNVHELLIAKRDVGVNACSSSRRTLYRDESYQEHRHKDDGIDQRCADDQALKDRAKDSG
jgi:hypothetical protein